MRTPRQVADLTGPPERVLTFGQGWDSAYGGISTFNRHMSIGLGEAGYAVTARVAHAGPVDPRVQLSVAAAIPGFHDDRVWLLDPQGLPAHADVIVGHSRFSGGPAAVIRAAHYPQARLIHVLHTSPELLGRLQQHPQLADRNTADELSLMAGADLVVGVGPLLVEEARRLARQATEQPPPVHECIPGVIAHPQPAYSDQPSRRAHLLLFGRANEPLKGVAQAADITRMLANRGWDAHLTIRGATPADAHQQERELSQRAGRPVAVKPFTADPEELARDLRGTDLVLVASLYEDFGLTATEAAGHGVPLLVGSHTGVGMLLGDPKRVPANLGAGSVVPDTATNVALWAERADAVLRDLPGERTRARALQAHLTSTFTWAGAATATMSALHEAYPDRAPQHPARLAGQAFAAPVRVAGTTQNDTPAQRSARPESPTQQRHRGR